MKNGSPVRTNSPISVALISRRTRIVVGYSTSRRYRMIWTTRIPSPISRMPASRNGASS